MLKELSRPVQNKTEKAETDEEVLLDRQMVMEKSSEKINQLELDLFNFANDEILGHYFWESAYDRGIERDFYKDLVPQDLQTEFKHDFDRTFSQKRYQLEAQERGHDSLKEAGFLTYEDLWKRYKVDPSAIIQKYSNFIDEHIIGGLSPYRDYTEEQKSLVKRNSNKEAWKDWGVDTEKVEKWTEKQNKLKKIMIEAQENFAKLFSLDFSSEVTKKIIEKYFEILNLNNRTKEIIKSFSGNKEVFQENVNSTNLLITEKAAAFLDEFTKKSDEESYKNVIDGLEKIKVEISLLAAVLKTIKESGERVALENIKDLDLSKKEIDSYLSDEEKAEIMDMVKENYLKGIYADNPKAARAVFSEVENELEEIKNQTTYTLKFQGKVVAFCRFKPVGENELYAGSLNVEKEVQGFAVAGYFLDQTLLEEAKNNTIHAITRVNNLANAKYKKLGFIFDPKTFFKNGVEYYNITLPKQNQLKKAA
jgi:hypothetical protein